MPKEDCGHDHGHGGHEGHAKHDHGHGSAPAPEGGGKSEDDMLVMRAAIAHVIGDILQSIGVCIAGALIWAFSDRWLDANGLSYWYRCAAAPWTALCPAPLGGALDAARLGGSNAPHRPPRPPHPHPHLPPLDGGAASTRCAPSSSRSS